MNKFYNLVQNFWCFYDANTKFNYQKRNNIFKACFASCLFAFCACLQPSLDNHGTSFNSSKWQHTVKVFRSQRAKKWKSLLIFSQCLSLFSKLSLEVSKYLSHSELSTFYFCHILLQFKIFTPSLFFGQQLTLYLFFLNSIFASLSHSFFISIRLFTVIFLSVCS